MFRSRGIATGLGLSLLSTVAMADAEFIYEGVGFEQDARIVVRSGKVLLTHNDQNTMSLVYDTVAELFRVLNHQEKTYLELSNEFVQTAVQGMEAMLPQLQALAATQQLSDSQRELLEKISSGAASRSNQESVSASVKPTSKEKNVLGLTCKVFSVNVAGESFEVCTIDYETVGLKPEDQESLRALSGTLEGLGSGLQFHEAQTLAAVIGSLDGIVLEAIDATGQEAMKLKQLTLAIRSSSDGEIPQGYSETDILSIFSGL